MSIQSLKSVRPVSIVLTLTLLIGGCATLPADTEGVSPGFGDATAHNKAVHFVPPTPEQKANTYIPADRSRQELARKRYRENDVETPKPIQTRD